MRLCSRASTLRGYGSSAACAGLHRPMWAWSALPVRSYGFFDKVKQGVQKNDELRDVSSELSSFRLEEMGGREDPAWYPSRNPTLYRMRRALSSIAYEHRLTLSFDRQRALDAYYIDIANLRRSEWKAKWILDHLAYHHQVEERILDEMAAAKGITRRPTPTKPAPSQGPPLPAVTVGAMIEAMKKGGLNAAPSKKTLLKRTRAAMREVEDVEALEGDSEFQRRMRECDELERALRHDDVKRALRAESDPARREELTQQLSDLKGGAGNSEQAPQSLWDRMMAFEPAHLKKRREEIEAARDKLARDAFEEREQARKRAEAVAKAERETLSAEPAPEGTPEDPNAPPRVTALVAGPPPSRWERFKERIGIVSPKNTRLYQRGLEMKEKLEDSDNPLVARTMDTLGAASDITASVTKKVMSPSEVAAALEKIRQAWPSFDASLFWFRVTRDLPLYTRAFHTYNLMYIRARCTKERFPILQAKAAELVKSQLDPLKRFYPFILRQPAGAEILNASVDDPLRPFVLIRFTIVKTAERVDAKSDMYDPDAVKMVKADFVLALQFEPDMGWVIYDFHEAKMDLTF